MELISGISLKMKASWARLRSGSKNVTQKHCLMWNIDSLSVECVVIVGCMIKWSQLEIFESADYPVVQFVIFGQ